MKHKKLGIALLAALLLLTALLLWRPWATRGETAGEMSEPVSTAESGILESGFSEVGEELPVGVDEDLEILVPEGMGSDGF